MAAKVSPAEAEAPWPGEDLAEASSLRQMVGMDAAEDMFTLSDGVTWARVVRAYEDGAGRPPALPVVLCGGGTGCAMLYLAFAERLSRLYGGDVLIWDRFNIGCSDRVHARGVRDGPELWTRQLHELLGRVGIARAHFIGISQAAVAPVPHFAVRYPDMVARLAFLAPIFGGLKADQAAIRAPRKMRKLLPRCLWMRVGVSKWKQVAIPRLVARCEGQVEEGGDPRGLPVAKGMYRVRGTTKAMVEQLLFTLYPFRLRGAPELVQGVANLKVPVFVRNYLDDSDTDKESQQAATTVAISGHEDSFADSKPGLHHNFYSDDTVEVLAKFFHASDSRRRV
eukprot:g3523.t1